MKLALMLILVCALSHAAERLTPELEPASEVELIPALKATKDFRALAPLMRRGLLCDQTSYRQYAAEWFIQHGTFEDVSYLIDALSDDTASTGANYPVAGMNTTRYWANVALIVICKTSFDYRHDASDKDREDAIMLWTQHWKMMKERAERKKASGR
ncbi:MAG: hypothetical protein V4662_07330 [Verrucomicrobiota bacterium]